MKNKNIEEFLTPELISKINEFVELNLNEKTILNLLSNELFSLSEENNNIVKNFILYIIWLKSNNKSTINAFEKFKKRLSELEKNEENKIEKPVKASNQEFYEDQVNIRRKEQNRIDELFKKNENEYLISKKQFNEIIEDLDDETLEQTVLMKLDQEKATPIDQEVEKFLQEIEKPVAEDSFGNEKTLSTQDFAYLNKNEELLEVNDNHDEKTTNLTIEKMLTDEENTKDLNEENEITLDNYDNQSQTIDQEFFLEDNQPISTIDLKTIVDSSENIEEEFEDESTQDALDFLQGIDNKYGVTVEEILNNFDELKFETIIEEDNASITKSISVENDLQQLSIGDLVKYKNEEYMILGVNVDKDILGRNITMVKIENINDGEIKDINLKKVELI